MTTARNKHKQKVLLNYFTKSFLIGLAVLVVVWIILLLNSDFGFSLDGLSKLHQSNGVLYFIDLIPIILGVYAISIGLKFYQKICEKK